MLGVHGIEIGGGFGVGVEIPEVVALDAGGVVADHVFDHDLGVKAQGLDLGQLIGIRHDDEGVTGLDLHDVEAGERLQDGVSLLGRVPENGRLGVDG